jgi:hypothetical protein
MEGGDEYTDMFRLTSAKMEELPSMVGSFLHQETNQSHVLSEKQLPQIALHWLGRGGQYHSVGDMQGVSMVNIQVCIPIFISDRRQYVISASNTDVNNCACC